MIISRLLRFFEFNQLKVFHCSGTALYSLGTEERMDTSPSFPSSGDISPQSFSADTVRRVRPYWSWCPTHLQGLVPQHPNQCRTTETETYHLPTEGGSEVFQKGDTDTELRDKNLPVVRITYTRTDGINGDISRIEIYLN